MRRSPRTLRRGGARGRDQHLDDGRVPRRRPRGQRRRARRRDRRQAARARDLEGQQDRHLRHRSSDYCPSAEGSGAELDV